MSTIVLYANKINQMPGMIKDVKQAVSDYESELFTLKNKALSINTSICNLEDVISSIQTSTQTQEQKIASLDSFNQNNKNFILNVVRIDGNVAGIVRQRRDDFYDKYYYLKPECEKDWKEYAKDWFDSACEWCKEHWKLLVTILIVVAAIVCLFIPGVNSLVTGLAYGKLMLAMASGALKFAGTCGLLGGTMSAIAGGSFWEGLKDGAFYGAIAGLVSGGMAFICIEGVTDVSLTFGQVLLTGAVSGGGASLVGDLGDTFIKGDDLSWEQMLLNTVISAVSAAAFAGVFYGLSKGFAVLKLKLFNGKANLPEAVGTVDDAIERAGGADAIKKIPSEVADILKNPQKLLGKTPEQIAEEFTKKGFKVTIRQSTRGSQKATILEVKGHKSIAQVQVHPGGGTHGGAPYVKISTATHGKIKIIGKGKYIDRGEKIKYLYKDGKWVIK